jgi:drug/metabolite transporter (DMT)-like permease
MKQINQTSFTSWIFLLSLATIWGVNFLFIKLAVEEIGPITNVFLRLLMASIILYVVMILQKRKLVLKPKLILFYFILGAFGLAIPFSLISSAEIHINAGLAGVLMSPMPLLTLALSAIILKNEIINFKKVLSFIIAFCGLLILFGFDTITQIGRGDSIEIISQLIVLLAAACYGLNAVLTKLVPEVNFISLATGVTIASVIWILPFALFFEPFWLNEFNSKAILSVSIQGIFATAIANLLFFKIIETRGPVFLSLINFLIPLIAYFSGAIFLNEEIEINVLLSLSLILFALYLNQTSNDNK